ncbi:sigma factor-like helix-turn-helix DNA-binding protein [Bradyrhizobium sp. CCBAU 53421]|uniref:sigma factor-like helix-turn-helix DNA-binding protein n=1 Tax=Bradyrhizobium sp. CCBAU 53421 TaxID=1325120 RepID=UPI00353009B7
MKLDRRPKSNLQSSLASDDERFGEAMPVWSHEDEQRLLQLARETDLTQREIGQKLGRSEAAVNLRLAC